MACGGCCDTALYLIGEPIYDPTHSYVAGDYLVVAGVLYKSLQSGNVGHNPQENPAWWTTTTILQELEGGGAAISAVSPLLLTGTELSIRGLTTVGNSNQLVGSTGSAWTYINSTGSGPVVRANSPTLTGTAITANLTVQGNLVVGSNTGQSIALGGANDLIGLWGAEPNGQPSVSYTAYPNPVTQTAAFMSLSNQILSGLLQLGAFKVG